MKKKILSLTLCAALLGGMSTSVCAAAEDYSEGEIHTIGVAMYDPDSAEMEMFGDYYRDYIEEGFPVKFIFSGKITDAQSECDFIEEAKENADSVKASPVSTPISRPDEVLAARKQKVKKS